MSLPLRRLRAVLAAGVLVAIFSAGASAADEARVRVLHASPDAPAVDVHVDGDLVDALTNVPFAALSEYLTLPAGEHRVEVFATGTDENAVIDATLALKAGTSYTVAATNALASIEAQVIVDDPAPTTDGAQLRVVHFSADAPPVDVAPDGAAPADAVVKNLSYPDATDYLSLPAGTYDLEVRLAGTTDVALQLAPVDLAAGQSYSVFAIGSVATGAENGLQVVVAGDAMKLPDTSTEDLAAAPAPSGVAPVALVAVGIALLFLARRWMTRVNAR
jgi:hypothetical protein